MNDWREAIDRQVDALTDELREVRRHLHAHPEPSREEFETTRYVSDRLRREGIAHRVVPSGRGIVAGPEGVAAQGPRVALRADMDALRLVDAKEVEYRSTRDGVMHACGHDAHTAMALGAALALHRCGDALPAPVAWARSSSRPRRSARGPPRWSRRGPSRGSTRSSRCTSPPSSWSAAWRCVAGSRRRSARRST